MCAPSPNPLMFPATVPCHTGSGHHAQVTQTHPLLPESTVSPKLPHFVMPFLLVECPPHYLSSSLSLTSSSFHTVNSQCFSGLMFMSHIISILKVSLDPRLPQNPQEDLQICLQLLLPHCVTVSLLKVHCEHLEDGAITPWS